MTRISVAMTTYCGEQYVEKQLQSLLEQSRKADQVVICDDNSHDNTAQIVASFIERNCLSNWCFLVNEKNIGYKKNFKKAISLTDADLVFLCDQDDIWQNDKLEKMEKIFEQYSGCKSLNSSFCYIDQNDNPIVIEQKNGMSNNNLIKRQIPENAVEKISFGEIVSYNISPGCTMAFTRDIKDIYLSKTQSCAVHDWEINLVASLLDGCYFYNSQTIKYRIHENNAVGIPGVSKSDGTSRGNHAYRLKIAELMCGYTDSFKVYLNMSQGENNKILVKQIEFANKRKQALRDKNVFKVLALNRYRGSYSNSVTRKGRMADIVCVLK